MQIKRRIVHRTGFLLVYIFAGIAASYLLTWIAEIYVDLFGETYTPMSKLFAWGISLMLTLIVVFSVNYLTIKLNNKRLGLSLALVTFLSLYIVGPGIRAPLTLYITSVSFPYNINMLAVLVLPLLVGHMLHRHVG